MAISVNSDSLTNGYKRRMGSGSEHGGCNGDERQVEQVLYRDGNQEIRLTDLQRVSGLCFAWLQASFWQALIRKNGDFYHEHG